MNWKAIRKNNSISAAHDLVEIMVVGQGPTRRQRHEADCD